MRKRASERGNTIMIATVLILGLTLMGLGVARIARTYTRDAADLKGAGYPAIQALYMAEMGINDLLFSLNEPAAVVTPPNYTPAAPLEGPLPAPYRPALDYGTYTITPTLSYRVIRVAELIPNSLYRYESVGTVTPEPARSAWPAIQRTLRVDVRLVAGYWVLENYTHE